MGGSIVGMTSALDDRTLSIVGRTSTLCDVQNTVSRRFRTDSDIGNGQHFVALNTWYVMWYICEYTFIGLVLLHCELVITLQVSYYIKYCSTGQLQTYYNI